MFSLKSETIFLFCAGQQPSSAAMYDRGNLLGLSVFHNIFVLPNPDVQQCWSKRKHFDLTSMAMIDGQIKKFRCKILVFFPMKTFKQLKLVDNNNAYILIYYPGYFMSPK